MCRGVPRCAEGVSGIPMACRMFTVYSMWMGRVRPSRQGYVSGVGNKFASGMTKVIEASKR